ncbi:hypothetical protein [Marinimicrococcus flavescens]|uniref:Outer membrane protein beta-barrel domain-containing protein n=1 Tax=Marinimicrococcus flavescens TaxID=3031815 RepID=A0AAP3XRT5_9PROT|nr:hypothetical protein [Marinimicrococcus flavescens]
MTAGCTIRRASPPLHLAFLAVCGACHAAPAGAAELLSEDWQFNLTPYLWALSIEGDVTVKGVEASPSVSFNDILDNLNYAIMLEGDARKERIGLFANVIYADLGDSGTVGPGPGLSIKADAKMTIAGAGAYYRLGPWNLDREAGASGPRLVVDPYAGIRYTYMDTDLGFRRIERDVGADKHWVDPIIGVRTLWELTPRWNVNVLGDIGGFGISGASDLSWQAVGLVGYRFGLFGSDDANLVAGYRALSQDYKDGNGRDAFKWDMILHGPVLGLAIAF